ncbi:hypothetical protein NP233_g9054 [Leucocoprinus birnbaumii]|uniref:F-box domain-containing protein n=1 Tax=Leucocoprinus birnbaumii TaxID=56174 RepID=A0AAD5YNI8_9AGAR|nr:hypothetical protein NP233_g9054 [Leucocoprinus birnbaumii]
MSLALHPDIWAEILKYFRITLVDTFRSNKHSAAEERARNRRVLLSVALTCSSLLDLAIAELWRTLSTLEHLIRVYSLPQEVSAPEYWEDGGYWNCNVAPERKEALAPRLQSYLRRIHFLHFQVFPSAREFTLWPILVVLSGNVHLCPNLKGIFLNLKSVTPSMTYHIAPLISPSITRLEITEATEIESENSAIALLSLINVHSTCSIRQVMYKGYISSAIFDHTARFHSLRKLEIRIQSPSPLVPLKTFQVERLRSLKELTSVALDMRSFTWGAVEAVAEWLEGLDALRDLMLEGTWKAIHRCAFEGVTFQQVQSLRLYGASPFSAEVFSLISSGFPQLHSLTLQILCNVSEQSPQQFRISDLKELRVHTVKKIALAGLPIDISLEDISDILHTWPLLETLSLIPATSSTTGFAFNAESALTRASRLGTRLRTIIMPFDFTSLTSALGSRFSATNSPLQHLTIFSSDAVPESWKDKQKLVANLLKLFPRLNTIDTMNLPKDSSNDLQIILDNFHQKLSCSSGRHDHLYLY